jgi:hypothetical protein
MTQDEIIEMAKEAGWHDDLLGVSFVLPMLKTFARLVAAKAIAELESQDHIEQHLEMVKQKHKNNIWEKQLSAAQLNELLQIKDGTWEADRNG